MGVFKQYEQRSGRDRTRLACSNHDALRPLAMPSTPACLHLGVLVVAAADARDALGVATYAEASAAAAVEAVVASMTSKDFASQEDPVEAQSLRCRRPDQGWVRPRD